MLSMELRQLRYFIAVAQELHFGRAASRLNMTQPPLSQQIQLLEANLGVMLFHRTKRRVELTTTGRLFLTEARAIVASAEAAVGMVQRVHRGEAGRLSVGWKPWADLTALPPMIRAFCDRYPDVQLEIHNLTVDEQVSALLSGTIDVGFVVRPHGPSSPWFHNSQLASRFLVRQSLAVVVPKSHKFASHRRIVLGRLSNEPYILFRRDSSPVFYDYLISLYQQHGLSLNVRHEADHPSTVLGLVAAGLGITILPYTVYSGSSDVVFCLFPQKYGSLEILLTWRRKNESALLKQFVQTIITCGTSIRLNAGKPQ
jgi:DNA-binding transcriptional LysR family regulator